MSCTTLCLKCRTITAFLFTIPCRTTKAMTMRPEKSTAKPTLLSMQSRSMMTFFLMHVWARIHSIFRKAFLCSFLGFDSGCLMISLLKKIRSWSHSHRLLLWWTFCFLLINCISICTFPKFTSPFASMLPSLQIIRSTGPISPVFHFYKYLCSI